jgi:cyclic 2,3-diphosphoglycerate synthetase
MKTAIALIDGEHYPPVIKSSLEEIQKKYELKSLVFLGGTEKVGAEIPEEMFGLPLVHLKTKQDSLTAALKMFKPECVIDLSDEPVLGYKERLELANISLFNNARYIGSDFQFDPPLKKKICNKPSISIIGTGKRVGKTAISAYLCRVLKEKGFDPVVIAMGRGGPEKPDLLDGSSVKIDAEFLVKMADQGKHAASDYFEDAMMSRITTIGCRRCGGGLAGQPYISNVAEGVELANKLKAGIIVVEGSGSAIPPIKTDATLIAVSANQPHQYVSGYFGPYRIYSSDLAIITNCESPSADEEKVELISAAIRKNKKDINIMNTVFRPKPLGDLKGKRVFFATTAPKALSQKLSDYMETNYGCEIIQISNELSNRKLLKQAISENKRKFDTLLTELKAAAVDVVARIGQEMGVPTVFCDNIPISTQNQDLESGIIDLANKAINRFKND